MQDFDHFACVIGTSPVEPVILEIFADDPALGKQQKKGREDVGCQDKKKKTEFDKKIKNMYCSVRLKVEDAVEMGFAVPEGPPSRSQGLVLQPNLASDVDWGGGWGLQRNKDMMSKFGARRKMDKTQKVDAEVPREQCRISTSSKFAERGECRRMCCTGVEFELKKREPEDSEVQKQAASKRRKAQTSKRRQEKASQGHHHAACKRGMGQDCN